MPIFRAGYSANRRSDLLHNQRFAGLCLDHGQAFPNPVMEEQPTIQEAATQD
jgi:hypothetical protein